MIICGRFPFLHTVNVAWLLRAQAEAAVRREPLEMVVRFDPTSDAVPTGMGKITEHLDFLRAFHFADTVRVRRTDDPEFGNIPIPGLGTDSAAILDPWYNTLTDHVIFPDPDRFCSVIDSLPRTGVVTTNGCFDILHPGHLATLAYAAHQGDTLIVLINSDRSVSRFKGPNRPIHSYRFRAALLSRLAPVDYVVVFDDDTPLPMLDRIRPQCHVKGGSFLPDRIAAETRLLGKWGGQVCSCPMVGTMSTTAILERYTEPPFPV
ncbi:adenylyltransferase/cytidyltransferase family protein [bacterium]|nr:adenylyltransferase/cytidyltransferase family protein [candidate division CSSED10-310 bacterium]